MTFSKLVGGVAAFTAGFTLAAGAVFAQTASNTDYTKGTYYYSYSAGNGQSQAVANPSSGNAATNSALNVQGANANPNQNSYQYYYSTDGSGSASANSTGINQGVNATTPGLPNTGFGDDARQTLLALGLSAIAFAVASYAVVKTV